MGADRLRLLRKILMRLRGTNFCTSSARFAPKKATKQSQMRPSRTKRTKTRVWSPISRIGCVRCVKFQRDLVARTFAPVGPFCTEFLWANQTIPNAAKLVWNAPEHEFRVQWGGSGVFVAKSYNATSGHELSHQFCTFSIKVCEPTKQSQLH